LLQGGSEIGVNSRFAIAIHILTLLGSSSNRVNSSDEMAGSIGVNPVVVRRITSMLRQANLVETKQGIAGAKLARAQQDITFLDAYKAVSQTDDLFSIHNNPNPNCQIGFNIQTSLDSFFQEAQEVLEQKLAKITLADMITDINNRIVNM